MRTDSILKRMTRPNRIVGLVVLGLAAAMLAADDQPLAESELVALDHAARERLATDRA